jgi:hypothetical protein
VERETQEDLEVLRRIVTESVHDLYQQAQERVERNCSKCHKLDSSFFAGMQEQVGFKAIHGRKELGPAITSLASYVPGHGIIVQLEAPAPVVDRDVRAWLNEAAPLTRWETLLRETRGEPEKTTAIHSMLLAPQHRRVHRLILTEKVVEVLAENGRNLRHLPADEHVTIAFTFRTPSREERQAQRTSLLRHYFPSATSDERAMSSGDDFSPRPMGSAEGSPAGGADFSRASGAPMGSGSARFGGSATTAGDLLLRQEKYAEAIAAFEKALQESGVDVGDRKAPIPARATEMVRKLIQAHVGAKNVSQAASLLQWLERSGSADEELTALRRVYLDLVGVLPTPEEIKAYLSDTRPDRRELLLDRLLSASSEDQGPARVPARMIVSCTRKQLDEVAAGKLSKLELAGKVTLKYYKAVTSPEKTKKDAGPGRAGAN